MSMIDMNEVGPCRVCKTPGKRARGSQDIEPLRRRIPHRFDLKTFYCEDCVAAAAQRSLRTNSSVQRIRRPGQ